MSNFGRNQSRKENVVKNKPSCENCPERPLCTETCKEVERWINQDYLGRTSKIVLENGIYWGLSTEKTQGGFEFLDYINHRTKDLFVELSPSYESWGKVKEFNLTEKVCRFIYSYYVAGRKISDIAINENASSQCIDRRHHQAKLNIKVRLEKLEKWETYIKDNLNYKSIRDYDMAMLFFSMFYSRRIVANIVGVHPSTMIKAITAHRKHLEEKNETSLCGVV